MLAGTKYLGGGQVSLNSATAQDITRRIWKLLEASQTKQAVELCQELNRIHPDYADGWHVASQVAERARLPGKSLEFIQRALDLDANNSGYLIHQATLLQRTGKVEEGLAVVRKLVGRTLESAAAYNILGSTLAHFDLHEEALAAFDSAIALSPTRPHYHFNRAAELRFLGRLKDAEAACNSSIKLNPQHHEAYLMRSDLRTQDAENNHVAELKSQLPTAAKEWRGHAQLHYALAKELEDLGEYRESFEYRSRGAKLRRAHTVYQPENDLVTMAAITKAFDSEIFTKINSSCDNSSPVFILGLPRTGTTLLERILNSHSQIHSAGELNVFARELVGQVRSKFGAAVPRDRFVELSSQIDFTELGEAYIRGTAALTGGCPHFIDKLPLNYLYAGLIHLALPNARIIHLRRHPMAACYAIYKQLFQGAYPFSYSLEEMGHYYVAYSQLMDHWRQVIPAVAMTEIHYEDLVMQTEAEARRILDFCGLQWEEQCLSFYRQKSASTTASAAQIRQPPHTRSVDQWRHYEEQLQPLKAILLAGGIQELE
jgi:tetratricopeptide (TPR) repeat protein